MSIFNSEDLRQISSMGISVSDAEHQVERFRKGFPWMKIVGPATPERGISVLGEEEADEAVRYADSAVIAGKCKFVPASGAASRMFKDIYSGLASLDAGHDVPENSPLHKLAGKIKDFAFYDEALFGEPEDSPEYRMETARKLLTEKGLGYGSKPKGVLRFHRYEDEVRTALAEHLVEAKEYMRNDDGTASLVITVSPEHKELFEAALEKVRTEYEKRYDVRYNVKFVFQRKETDTIAVDAKDRPFRTDEGSLLFRPAGHGALIHNLNEIEEELVSIKNIDNVAVERMLPVTARYKKVLIGKCLQIRDTIFDFLRQFDEFDDASSGQCRHLCDKVEAFLDRELCIQLPLTVDPAERAALLRSKLDRPIRVCGMVKNEGEPGGGPFIIHDRKDRSSNLQILEGAQLNPTDAYLLRHSTHFNPVDLVCCLRNYKGEKFNLLDYVDEEAGFISSKSYQGRELKALELPGLWNGAMSDWNTAFVEVPVETFNPVKVVLDLLRPAHQA